MVGGAGAIPGFMSGIISILRSCATHSVSSARLFMCTHITVLGGCFCGLCSSLRVVLCARWHAHETRSLFINLVIQRVSAGIFRQFMLPDGARYIVRISCLCRGAVASMRQQQRETIAPIKCGTKHEGPQLNTVTGEANRIRA